MFWKRNRSASLHRGKLDIIDLAIGSFGVRSFADLGGVWGVNGGYTFYALDKHTLSRAVLVDTHITEIVTDRARRYPQLTIVKGNFGDANIARTVGSVDAVFLFDVLLHQVRPNWDQVLDLYAANAKCLIIFNQQWIGSNHTVRLLDLGEDAYFQNVPHSRTEETYANLFRKLDEKHPDHDRTWRDVHHIWQWGITDKNLQDKIESLGFRLQFFRNWGMFFTLKNFENHAYIFTR